MDGEIRAVDFSFARISTQQLLAAGCKHVFRYLAFLPNGKVITKPERDADVAAGITVHYNWETTATGILVPGNGAAYGTEAARQLAALGDAGHTVIFSLDTDPSAVNLGLVFDNLAAASHHVRVGVYGGAKLIDASATWSFVAERWQTAAWSGSYLSPHADYYQRIGHSWSIPGVGGDQYDEDVVIHAGLVPAQPPTPQHPEAPLLAPHYNVTNAYPCVDVLACPTGGFWQLFADGSIEAWLGAPYLGGANGKPYFVGRIAARLEDDGKRGYIIRDTANEPYDFPAAA
jgi:hypothetical protein